MIPSTPRSVRLSSDESAICQTSIGNSLVVGGQSPFHFDVGGASDPRHGVVRFDESREQVRIRLAELNCRVNGDDSVRIWAATFDSIAGEPIDVSTQPPPGNSPAPRTSTQDHHSTQASRLSPD